MSDPVVELVETLKAVRLEVAAISQKIDTKAATPAQLTELAKAVKAANPTDLAASIEAAGERAGQNIEHKIERRIGDAANDLRASSTRLAGHETSLQEAVQNINQTVSDVKAASFWLNFRAITVLAVAVLLLVAGSLVSLAWQQHESASLRTQEIALRAQIQTDKANLAALDAKGGRVKWNTCGGKLCFQAAPNQGTKSAPFPNWSGWGTPKRHIVLIIPRGY
jgi:hypothetical protein